MIWSGVFPAVTTKLMPDGALDLVATQASIHRLIGNGVSGVIVLPMLGENAALTQAERDRVVAGAREVVAGRVPLLSGLAELSTESAVAANRNYRRLGAEGLMVFPSLAYRTDRVETVAWYQAVAAATDLPIMIYNNPLAFRVDVDIATLTELAGIDNIVCIKEETGDVRRVTDLYNAFGDRFGVFCGVDDLILESLALGVTGCRRCRLEFVFESLDFHRRHAQRGDVLGGGSAGSGVVHVWRERRNHAAGAMTAPFREIDLPGRALNGRRGTWRGSTRADARRFKEDRYRPVVDERDAHVRGV